MKRDRNDERLWGESIRRWLQHIRVSNRGRSSGNRGRWGWQHIVEWFDCENEKVDISSRVLGPGQSCGTLMVRDQIARPSDI
jgi:hypothetical protein